MTHEPTCSDCSGKMEEGFVVDALRMSFIQAQWHPGEPHPKDSIVIDLRQFFGFNIPDLIVEPQELQPIFARRCVECGMLKLYAGKPKNGRQQDED